MPLLNHESLFAQFYTHVFFKNHSIQQYIQKSASNINKTVQGRIIHANKWSTVSAPEALTLLAPICLSPTLRALSILAFTVTTAVLFFYCLTTSIALNTAVQFCLFGASYEKSHKVYIILRLCFIHSSFFISFRNVKCVCGVLIFMQYPIVWIYHNWPIPTGCSPLLRTFVCVSWCMFLHGFYLEVNYGWW